MYASNPMALRHTTPPTYSNGMWYPGSVESQYSVLYGSSSNGSPESANTADTSPRTSSPGHASTIRCNGPTLLPKIRCQDQPKEPLAGNGAVNPPPVNVRLGVPTIHTAFTYGHPFKRRATASPEARAVGVDSPMSACSLPSSYFSSVGNAPSGLSEMASTTSVRPSPLGTEYISQVPNLATLDTSAAISGSRRSSLAHVRSISGTTLPSPADTHSRNASTGSSTVVDETTLLKHGYPTQYRGMPQYITASPSPVTTPTTVTLTPTLPVQPIPQMQYHQVEQQQQNFDHLLPAETIVSPQATSAFEQMMISSQSQPTGPTTTLMDYLTGPGATPSLIARSVTNLQAVRDFGWWDVRNLRSWSGFNMETLHSIPSLPELLQFPLDQNTLPTQPSNAATHGSPENEFALRDMFFDTYGRRVNAALQVAQGRARHLSLRVLNSSTNNHCPKPDFIATYSNDGFIRTTARGEMRGHVVGIVKSYDEWNTGMRSEDAPRQVKYLRGLAQLHRIMRDHGCRYGFIVTEIEIICVRAGAEQPEMPHPTYRANAFGSDEGPRPIFGWLELSNPIPLSTPGVSETGAYNMTPALALWLLCMMARDEPLPGQAGWRMDVGGPAALSRHNHRERDKWMPKIGVHESRVAKRIRGWVHPEDPFSRKEAPGRRGRR